MLILDTGLPKKRPKNLAERGAWVLEDGSNSHRHDGADRIPDPVDGYVDPAAGHGIFIAGIIRRFAPKTRIQVSRVLNNSGAGQDAEIVKCLEKLETDLNDKTPAHRPQVIVNMSFSGYSSGDEEPIVLGSVIRRLTEDHGVTFVASAGNDASCRAPWPARMPGVIAVGAVGPDGPAWFTNYGQWVDACAPGVDIVSNYFDGELIDKDADVPTDSRIKDFKSGWAEWSGTSFAAPMVVAAILRQIELHGGLVDSAGNALPIAERSERTKAAVSRVVEQPEALRIPNLGQVVDLS